jgi:hypothetical protein
MYFSLTNSSATFQTMMNEIFQDLITEGVVSVYLDDILIFTNSLEEHRRITRLVLDCMREHKLYLRPEKCEFEKTRIEYLSVIISHNKVEIVRGHRSISLPHLLYSLPSTHTPPCAYVHPLLPLHQHQDRRPSSPIVDDLGILKSSTIDSHLRSYLSHIGQASDTQGHIHATLRHPLDHVDS